MFRSLDEIATAVAALSTAELGVLVPLHPTNLPGREERSVQGQECSLLDAQRGRGAAKRALYKVRDQIIIFIADCFLKR